MTQVPDVLMGFLIVLSAIGFIAILHHFVGFLCNLSFLQELREEDIIWKHRNAVASLSEEIAHLRDRILANENPLDNTRSKK
jgi:hypothetical protein